MPQPLSTTRISSSPPCGHRDVDPRRPGVDRVLHQLLDDAGRPLDHLAGGDLVDDALARVGGSWAWCVAMQCERTVESGSCTPAVTSEAACALELVFLDLAIQRPLADAEHSGRFLAIAAGHAERLGDEQPFDLRQRLADQRGQRVAGAARSTALSPAPTSSSGRSSTSSTPS